MSGPIGPIGIAEIRRCRPESITAVSLRVESQRRRLVAATQHVLHRRAVGGSWSGAASSAAADRYDSVLGRLAGMGRRLGVGAQSLSHAAVRMRAAQALVRDAERRAARAGASLADDGRLVLPPRVHVDDPVVRAHQAREEALLAIEVSSTLRMAERVANETDAELANDLVDAAQGTVPPGSTGVLTTLTPPPIPSGRAHEAVFATAAWWRSLTDEEKGRLIEERPEWVGPRDGIPAADRHAANLILLGRAERAAMQALEEAKAADELGATFAMGLAGAATARAHRRVDELRAVREVVGRRDGRTRQLLLVDARGELVQAAVSVGDVDTAGHVTTFVGGLSTAVGTDLARYDDRFSAMREKAWTMTTGAGDAADVAIITWMGYEAPQVDEIVLPNGRSVLDDEIARTSGESLAAFVNGIDASRDRPPHQTLWAHSYGSLVAGYALARRTALDDVVLYGSPGTSLRSIVETGLKPGALNVLKRAEPTADPRSWWGPSWDLVSLTHWFVNDPAGIPGAERLATTDTLKPGDPNVCLIGSNGHSEYDRSGSASEYNLVAVAAGRPDLEISRPTGCP